MLSITTPNPKTTMTLLEEINSIEILTPSGGAIPSYELASLLEKHNVQSALDLYEMVEQELKSIDAETLYVLGYAISYEHPRFLVAHTCNSWGCIYCDTLPEAISFIKERRTNVTADGNM